MTVGTGLAHTLVIDGEPYAGARGEALAFGELLTESGDTLERVASGAAIAARYTARTGRVADARELFARAAADEDARSTITSAATALAAGLAALDHLLDPGLIVVGGGIASGESLWWQTVRETLPRLLARGAPPRLVRGALGGDAGVIGAAMLHRERLRKG